ncbi:MAG: hypothetical protein QOF29_3787, partial [bacterium]
MASDAHGARGGLAGDWTIVARQELRDLWL